MTHMSCQESVGLVKMQLVSRTARTELTRIAEGHLLSSCLSYRRLSA